MYLINAAVQPEMVVTPARYMYLEYGKNYLANVSRSLADSE